MRLIDADELLYRSRRIAGMMELRVIPEWCVTNAPTIDAVPVVRCKDCRYSEPIARYVVCIFGENALNCTQCRGDDGYGYAGISVINPEDYCSDGAPLDGDPDG